MNGFVFFAFFLGVAFVCTIMGMILTKRRRKPPPPEIKAYVVCSLCFCSLSGLEHFCPTCGKPLYYAVRSRQIAPPPPAQQKSKPARTTKRKAQR